jgi:hypothetical protein
MIWKDDPCQEFQEIRTNEADLSTNGSLMENPDEVVDETHTVLQEDRLRFRTKPNQKILKKGKFCLSPQG